jgi:hypothetical protein
MIDIPLLDDRATCPGCGDDIGTWLLCEHDDPATGPLCVDRCCPAHHDDTKAAA